MAEFMAYGSGVHPQVRTRRISQPAWVASCTMALPSSFTTVSGSALAGAGPCGSTCGVPVSSATASPTALSTLRQ